MWTRRDAQWSLPNYLISCETIITAAAGGGLCQPVQSAKSFFRADGGRSLSVAVARSFRKQDSVRARPLRNEVRDGLFADATREAPMKRFEVYEISLQMVSALAPLLDSVLAILQRLTYP
jgi:DNA-binding protein Fis